MLFQGSRYLGLDDDLAFKIKSGAKPPISMRIPCVAIYAAMFTALISIDRVSHLQVGAVIFTYCMFGSIVIDFAMGPFVTRIFVDSLLVHNPRCQPQIRIGGIVLCSFSLQFYYFLLKTKNNRNENQWPMNEKLVEMGIK